LTKEKLRLANLGKRASEETKGKIRNALSKYWSTRKKSRQIKTLDSFMPGARGGTIALPWQVKLSKFSNISYVVGVLNGDGFLTKHYTVGMAVVDRSFADMFAQALRKIGLSPRIHIYPPYNGLSKLPLWRVVAHSKMFYTWLTSLSTEKLDEILSAYPLEFIRDFYESEGSCYQHNGMRVVSFCNTNPDLLIRVQEMLKKLGFHPSRMYSQRKSRGIWRNQKDLHSFHLARNGEIERFIERVNPVIKRGGVAI
jgi:DNA endonuclease